MEDGSPLLVYSQRQLKKLQKKLEMPVALGMTLWQPKSKSGRWAADGAGRWRDHRTASVSSVFTGTTTAAASMVWTQSFKQMPAIPSYRFIRDYYAHPSYTKALAERVFVVIGRKWPSGSFGLLFPRHSEAIGRWRGYLPQHCEATTKLLLEELGLSADDITMTYQSRWFGREEWLKPYTGWDAESLPLCCIKERLISWLQLSRWTVCRNAGRDFRSVQGKLSLTLVVLTSLAISCVFKSTEIRIVDMMAELVEIHRYDYNKY